MKRREFLGAALAAPALAAPAANEQASALPKAHWLENGLIEAGGSHEPYIFVVRRGGQRLDARDEYERA